MSALDRLGPCMVAIAAVTLLNAAIPGALDPAAVPISRRGSA